MENFMMIDAITTRGDGEPSFDILTAGDLELLLLTKSYLERVRAHPRLIEAVGRAALRLMDMTHGNGSCQR